MIFSFIGCMLCLCIMAASVGGVLLSMYIVQVTADDAETLDLDNQKNRQTSIVYDINGNEYASLSRNENRIWRELSAMPENLQNAVIAIEDKNFRTEPGINLKGTIGAALNAFTGNRIWLSLIHILRAHETGRKLVCRLLLEKKKKKKKKNKKKNK